jgi:hypothetical protein
MPGSLITIFVVAFNLDDRGQPVQAFEPRLAATEASAVEEAQELAQKYKGAVVWKREGDTAVGEVGEPVIVYSAGITGDFA